MEQSGQRSVDQFKLKPDFCADGSFKGYSKLHWINSAAIKNPLGVYNNLIHHINEDNLITAFRGLDGSKAVGVDRVTKSEYQKNLLTNIQSLSEKIRLGGWRPKPSREVLIPKPSGGKRPLAVGCLEDKVVQALVAKILEAIYEPVFHRLKMTLGYQMKDITTEHGSEYKHKTKSRMRKLRTSGSARSSGRQRPLFT